MLPFYVRNNKTKLKKKLLIIYYKIESKYKLKETDIKNLTCYYFDDIIGFMDRDNDSDFNDIFLD